MRRALPLLLVIVLSLNVAACGSDDKEEPAASTTSTEPDTIPEDTQPDRTEDRKNLIIAPVLSSGGCPPEVAASQTTEPEAETETETEATEAEDTEPETTVPAAEATETTAAAATATSDSGPFPTADGIFCYSVGEQVGDGNDLTDATLSETDGEYQVFTRVKPDSVDKLNAAFNACFNGQPECPAGEGGRGYMAFVWEDVVLYAPAIQTEDIAEEGLSLAGGLTERRARELITLINR